MKKPSTRRTESSSVAATVQKSQKNTSIEKKLEKLKLLELKKELKENLPHLHGFKLYPWQRAFIDSTAKMNLICAGNQLGKSLCNILKLVMWATEPSLWPKLWKKRPIQFWYLLPTKDLVTTEFNTKWVPEVLPRGPYKDHPQYGWQAEFRNKHLWAIHFNTGVSVYMHTYEQDVHHLQAATVDAIFVDEEVPWDLMPELLLRINARDGYFNSVMTPTRGQEMWRRVFELQGDGEVFPDAFKQRVSMYDCKLFEDGSRSHWTDERILQTLNRLATQQEIDLRVHGRFVLTEGLILSAFTRDANLVRPEPIPSDWFWYSGVDLGGGGSGSLPAIVFIAIRPDFQYGRVVKVWRGTSSKVYTASDVLDKYIEMRGGRSITGEYYDFASKDFGTWAQRAGVGMQPAEKSREIGFPLLNTLFRNKMLVIDDTMENLELVNEILNLRHGVKKTHANDHATDAMRYGVVKIPWNLEGISGEKLIRVKPKEITIDDQRRGLTFLENDGEAWSIEEELEEWGAFIDPDF